MDKHDQSPVSEEAELNPVEWIMVTRSDPGGGIPRFMVERGTPAGISTDACKFLDWACAKQTIPNPDDDQEIEKAAVEKSKEPVQATPQTNGETSVPSTTAVQKEAQAPAQQQQGGIFSHLTNALEAGLETYAPASVSGYASQYLRGEEPPQTEAVEAASSDSDSSSFVSADDNFPAATAVPSSDSLAVSPTPSLDTNSSTKGLNQHDKELHKLAEKQRKLDEKLAKKRQSESEKLKSQQEKEATDDSKAREKHDKEVKKQEEKHAKEIAKLEQKREKELKKQEEKKKKSADRDALGKVTRERDEFRDQVGLLKRENELLRDQIGELQRLNTGLVAKVGGDGVEDVIADGGGSGGRIRSGSGKSQASNGGGGAASLKGSLRSVK